MEVVQPTLHLRISVVDGYVLVPLYIMELDEQKDINQWRWWYILLLAMFSDQWPLLLPYYYFKGIFNVIEFYHSWAVMSFWWDSGEGASSSKGHVTQDEMVSRSATQQFL